MDCSPPGSSINGILQARILEWVAISFSRPKERREVKGKGERERYIQQNPEFKRIARRVKKTFFNEQCKEIEENHKRRNTRDLFKKTGNMKGTFQGRMGTIKDRNNKDLIEAEEIKKRWQEYTELYKKVLNDPDNHDGV